MTLHVPWRSPRSARGLADDVSSFTPRPAELIPRPAGSRHVPRRSRCADSPSPTPMAFRPCSASTSSVDRGERVALLGPNGAGKTTLALHLNGVLTAGAGSVHVRGLELTKANLKEIRRRVAIVFQDPDDQLFMPTVREDVAFGPANLGLAGAELDARVMMRSMPSG